MAKKKPWSKMLIIFFMKIEYTSKLSKTHEKSTWSNFLLEILENFNGKQFFGILKDLFIWTK